MTNPSGGIIAPGQRVELEGREWIVPLRAARARLGLSPAAWHRVGCHRLNHWQDVDDTGGIFRCRDTGYFAWWVSTSGSSGAASRDLAE